MLALVRFKWFRALANMAIVACLTAPALVSAQTTINFDDVANGTDIRTHYQGVTFSCEGTSCSNPAGANGIYARITQSTASLPNSVTPWQAGNPGISIRTNLIASFANPVKTVSIDARTFQLPETLVVKDYAKITAYDAQNAVVATAIGTQFNTFETLSVAAGDNRIAKVSIGLTGPTSVADIDNLKFSMDPIAWWPPILIILILVFTIYFVRSFIKRRKAH